MDWLNYHHLRYFHAVAREGSLARAAEKLRVSQPAISEQIHDLEDALGVKLFERDGRGNKLTDSGRLVLGYAEEIFALGQEMLNTIRQRPGIKTLRFHVGVTDSVPKLVTNEILKPAFALPQKVHVICREGKLHDLLPQLAAHHLDIVFSDEPAPTNTAFKTFTDVLGESGSVFCAERTLATRLRRGFPRSLHEAPALLPAENTMLRRALDVWLREKGLRPTIIAECEDLSLMKAMATEGRGFIAVPTVALDEAVRRYGFEVIGHAETCRLRFHAITAERRIRHPAATAITSAAKLLMDSHH